MGASDVFLVLKIEGSAGGRNLKTSRVTQMHELSYDFLFITF